MRHFEKRAARGKLLKALREGLSEEQNLELHRFLMPATVGTAMWGVTGAALAPKGKRQKAFASGAALGAIRPAT